jgi:hypothetical protein
MSGAMPLIPLVLSWRAQALYIRLCEVPVSNLDWRGCLFPAQFSSIFRSPAVQIMAESGYDSSLTNITRKIRDV